MSRQKDSTETKNFKIRMTKLFIEAVEAGGMEQGPKSLEEAFAIGGGSASGVVWCAYRRGARSMLFPTLQSKIKMAVNGGYITKAKADSILSKLPSTEAEEPPQPEAEEYTFDSTELFLTDIEDTVKLLMQQADAYLKMLPKNHVMLSESLKPLGELIHQVATPTEFSINSEGSHGYRPRWWI